MSTNPRRQRCQISQATAMARWENFITPPFHLPSLSLAYSHGCQASPEQVNAFFEGLLPEQKEHVTPCRRCAVACAAWRIVHVLAVGTKVADDAELMLRLPSDPATVCAALAAAAAASTFCCMQHRAAYSAASFS
jgi:hypothetical protein